MQYNASLYMSWGLCSHHISLTNTQIIMMLSLQSGTKILYVQIITVK